MFQSDAQNRLFKALTGSGKLSEEEFTATMNQMAAEVQEYLLRKTSDSLDLMLPPGIKHILILIHEKDIAAQQAHGISTCSNLQHLLILAAGFFQEMEERDLPENFKKVLDESKMLTQKYLTEELQKAFAVMESAQRESAN